MNAPAPRRTILVVDDQEEIRELLRDMLEERGYQVFDACDGLEALQQAELRKPDLVITDLIMPQKGGIDAIRTLRNRNPVLRIVAMSGAVEGFHLRVARVVGASEVIRKPFDPGEVLEIVGRLLEEPPDSKDAPTSR